ncbi:hypothetical protein ACS0TY_034848 [Phlomoides rotata]
MKKSGSLHPFSLLYCYLKITYSSFSLHFLPLSFSCKSTGEHSEKTISSLSKRLLSDPFLSLPLRSTNIRCKLWQETSFSIDLSKATSSGSL